MVQTSFHFSASPRSATLMLAAVFALVTTALAEDGNPFARPGNGPAPVVAQPPSPLDTLEFRGLAEFGGTTFVTLYDSATSKATVLALGRTANGVTVSEYQLGDNSVLVQSGANSRRVQWKATKIVAMAVPPPQQIPQPGAPVVAGVPPVPGQPGAVGDDEVRNRMQRVAEEIRRRREMRRDILERQGQPQQRAAPTQ